MSAARRIEVIGLASLVGMSGIVHGLGEALQGSVAPPAIVFASWADVPWFEVLAGEPAMSLVPNLLASGVLTMAVSLAFLIAAGALAGHRHLGAVLLALSGCLLLVGGGFGPPILGVLVAAAAAQAGKPVRAPGRLSGDRARGRLAATWPWLFAITLAAWLLVFPGIPALAAVVELDGPSVVPAASLLAFALVPLGIAAAVAFDARATERTTLHGARS